MSYGGLYGGEANLAFSGAYTPPTGDAVDLEFVFVASRFTILGKSQVQIDGFEIRPAFADFDISSFSLAEFSNAARAVDITSGTVSVYVETPLRAPQIFSETSWILRAGARVDWQSQTVVDVACIAALPAATTISESSVLSLEWLALANATSAVPTKTTIKLAGAYNKDFSFSIPGKTTVVTEPSFVTAVEYSVVEGSTLNMASRYSEARIVSLLGHSDVVAVGTPLFRAATTIPSAADLVMLSVPSRGGYANILSTSACSIVSSYVANTPTYSDKVADCLYVRLPRTVVYVRSP